MHKRPFIYLLYRNSIYFLFLILTVSCTVFKEDKSEIKKLSQLEKVSDQVPIISAKWWEHFNDQQLNLLLEQSLKDSPSISTADARMQAARALMLSNQSVLLPQVALNTQANRQRLSENYIFPQGFDSITNYGYVAGTFNWSLDLWGKQKRLIDGSKYRLVSAQAQLDTAKLNLAIAVVTAYIEYDYACKSLLITKVDVHSRLELVQIAQERYRVGTVDLVVVNQAKVEYQDSHAQELMVENQVKLWRHQLAALVGQGPSFGDQIKPPNLQVQVITNQKITKIPSDLIARRPDLQGLLSQIEASRQDLKAAHLDYLPSFDITANYGLQAFGLGNLINSGSQIFSLGPVINLPIFNGGKIDANITAKEATKNQAIADYHEQLLMALRQSADGISSVQSSTKEWQSKDQSLQAAKQINEIFIKRHHAGVMSLEQLDQAQIVLDQKKLAEVSAQKQIFNAHVSLIQALGGGYFTNAPLASSTLGK